MIDDLNKLERALNTEVRRRVDYSRTLQIITENYANEMLDRLQKKLMKKLEQITVALESLAARCLTLERGILQFKGELPSKLLIDTTTIMKRVTDCKRILESLRSDTMSQKGDESAIRNLADIEYKLDAKMESMYGSLETEIQEMHGEVKHLSDRNIKDEQEFQEFVMEE